MYLYIINLLSVECCLLLLTLQRYVDFCHAHNIFMFLCLVCCDNQPYMRQNGEMHLKSVATRMKRTKIIPSPITRKGLLIALIYIRKLFHVFYSTTIGLYLGTRAFMMHHPTRYATAQMQNTTM